MGKLVGVFGMRSRERFASAQADRRSLDWAPSSKKGIRIHPSSPYIIRPSTWLSFLEPIHMTGHCSEAFGSGETGGWIYRCRPCERKQKMHRAWFQQHFPNPLSQKGRLERLWATPVCAWLWGHNSFPKLRVECLPQEWQPSSNENSIRQKIPSFRGRPPTYATWPLGEHYLNQGCLIFPTSRFMNFGERSDISWTLYISRVGMYFHAAFASSPNSLCSGQILEDNEMCCFILKGRGDLHACESIAPQLEWWALIHWGSLMKHT